MRPTVKELKQKANQLRKKVLETTLQIGISHLGGTFSCMDILVALYYGGILKIDHTNPKWSKRDRFLIGKGHACLALYHIWVELGLLDESRLRKYEQKQYGEEGTTLNNQLNLSIPGCEYATGSLGHAIGVGAGMALSGKIDHEDYKTFVLVGDGECSEGSIWESIIFAGRTKLDNLIAIVDRNRFSMSNVVEDDDGSGSIDEKFIACGWECTVIDGHSFKEIIAVFDKIEELEKPLAIIADTIKGKGVSFMKGAQWHCSVLTKENFDNAVKELEMEIL